MNIFYQELKYESIVEKPEVEIGSLLGELGGSLGLFIGASVLSILEFIDYALLTIVAKCAGCGKTKGIRPVVSE